MDYGPGDAKNTILILEHRKINMFRLAKRRYKYIDEECAWPQLWWWVNNLPDSVKTFEGLSKKEIKQKYIDIIDSVFMHSKYMKWPLKDRVSEYAKTIARIKDTNSCCNKIAGHCGD